MSYKGSRHCGRVAFEVEGEINGAVACNCSICQRKGNAMAAINIRCLEHVDLAAIPVQQFDGRSL